MIYIVVYIERAQRRILIQYPKRQVGNRMYGGENSHLPLKTQHGGRDPADLRLVSPPIAAHDDRDLLLRAIGRHRAGLTSVAALSRVMDSRCSWWLFAALIAFFVFFYTAVVFNPDDVADNLKKQGGFVPGIRPGKRTAEYLDYVLTRLSVVGAIYLVAICLLPEILRTEAGVTFYFGGTSLLIVVSVTMDTITQIQSHLMAHQYEGLIEKSKIRGKRRKR